MPTIPLYGEAMYTKLWSVRDGMSDVWPQIAPVFVPVGPSPVVSKEQRPPIRILFIGQTAYQNGSEEPPFAAQPSLGTAAQRYASAEATLLKNPGASPFWRAVAAVMTQTLGAIGATGWMDRLPEIVGWSNLCKLHLVQEGTHNPKPTIIAPQAEVCIEALRMEIQTARPTLTIFMSGNWAEKEILLPACGSTWQQTSPQADRVAVCEHAELGPLLWINHPTQLQFGRNGEQSEGLGFVAGYAAALARSRR